MAATDQFYPCPFMGQLSVAAFFLWQQHPSVVSETLRPSKSEIFIIWLITGKKWLRLILILMLIINCHQQEKVVDRNRGSGAHNGRTHCLGCCGVRALIGLYLWGLISVLNPGIRDKEVHSNLVTLSNSGMNLWSPTHKTVKIECHSYLMKWCILGYVS